MLFGFIYKPFLYQKLLKQLYRFFHNFGMSKAVFGLVKEHYGVGLIYSIRKQMFVKAVGFSQVTLKKVTIVRALKVFLRYRNAYLSNYTLTGF